MLLELGKALSFLLSLLSLYPVAISAFFDPENRWEDRLELALPRVAIAACLCVASGMIFRWPSRSNPDAGQPLSETLPVRLFLWAVPGMALLFVLCWYLVWGTTCAQGFHFECAAN
jgi:hypothetical protein